MLVAKLDPKIVTKISFSIDYEAQEALKDKLVSSLYVDRIDLDLQIQTFAKRYALIGAHRDAIQTNKLN